MLQITACTVTTAVIKLKVEVGTTGPAFTVEENGVVEPGIPVNIRILRIIFGIITYRKTVPGFKQVNNIL